MTRTSSAGVGSAVDPLAYVEGLRRLIPEERIVAILSRTGRGSGRRRRLPAESVARLVIVMALSAADSIPKAWRRLHPTRDEPEPTDSAFSPARKRLGVEPMPGVDRRQVRLADVQPGRQRQGDHAPGPSSTSRAKATKTWP